MEEVLHVVQGQVDNWRRERINAYKIAEAHQGTANMPPITQFYSLPYDEELDEPTNDTDSMRDFYEQAKREQQQAGIWHVDMDGHLKSVN